MKELIVATKNEGKVEEFRSMFSKYNIAVKSLLDIDRSIEIDETGSTFEENATIKAEEMSEYLGLPVVADDSGLEVDALNGKPGVYSARYAGIEKDDDKNTEKLLKNLEKVDDQKRTARFVCAVAVARPGEKTFVERGTCEGTIARDPQGTNGFGYDPVFIPEGSTRTMAEHSSDEKNAISHRYHAIEKIEEWLKTQS
ncbi:XTP/dITP diphosphohydrolase [Halobacillus karajensis]|uniref:dITP/XTP pyrophosphatase n=1 Tax=Halobacillus karajensis TaxID=195088 RepID=A0A024P698_9BACI|nr:XTP/dITP diphosphatase [Halobacillus karajensis]CDQ18222.1 Non-canonical purine NTP pyrophosphatase [Halobacillus karajensis]CDQ24574.1 Non-canonical purine NTP pyrophosphatase [Halobacillus karajensis]CDQ29179.1 Non-canonical purine NTP pyrophosphatase [Halobacillus karajensis]SEH56920.1 XTP/dITP diphosphohydrolase [Halobacillus karajensis]